MADCEDDDLELSQDMVLENNGQLVLNVRFKMLQAKRQQLASDRDKEDDWYSSGDDDSGRQLRSKISEKGDEGEGDDIAWEEDKEREEWEGSEEDWNWESSDDEEVEPIMEKKGGGGSLIKKLTRSSDKAKIKNGSRDSDKAKEASTTNDHASRFAALNGRQRTESEAPFPGIRLLGQEKEVIKNEGHTKLVPMGPTGCVGVANRKDKGKERKRRVGGGNSPGRKNQANGGGGGGGGGGVEGKRSSGSRIAGLARNLSGRQLNGEVSPSKPRKMTGIIDEVGTWLGQANEALQQAMVCMAGSIALGVDKDENEALRHFTAAHELGHPRGTFRLGLAHLAKHDEEQAKVYIQQAFDTFARHTQEDKEYYGAFTTYMLNDFRSGALSSPVVLEILRTYQDSNDDLKSIVEYATKARERRQAQAAASAPSGGGLRTSGKASIMDKDTWVPPQQPQPSMQSADEAPLTAVVMLSPREKSVNGELKKEKKKKKGKEGKERHKKEKKGKEKKDADGKRQGVMTKVRSFRKVKRSLGVEGEEEEEETGESVQGREMRVVDSKRKDADKKSKKNKKDNKRDWSEGEGSSSSPVKTKKKKEKERKKKEKKEKKEKEGKGKETGKRAKKDQAGTTMSTSTSTSTTGGVHKSLPRGGHAGITRRDKQERNSSSSMISPPMSPRGNGLGMTKTVTGAAGGFGSAVAVARTTTTTGTLTSTSMAGGDCGSRGWTRAVATTTPRSGGCLPLVDAK